MRHCVIGQFLACGISVILIFNCGIIQTCGMRFLGILDGIKNSRSSPPTFFEPFQFLIVSFLVNY